MNLSITQRQNKNRLTYFIYVPRGLKISKLFFLYRIFIFLWIKNLKFVKTHFSFTKKFSISLMKTAEGKEEQRHEHFEGAHLL